MTYKALSPHLHPTADAAKKFAREQWGVNRIREEESLSREITLRPTILAKMNDYHSLCLEISESRFPQTAKDIANACKNNFEPVRLYVTIPRGIELRGTDYQSQQNEARENGVGLIEVDEHSGRIIDQALSLSLTGVRKFPPKEFCPRFRQPVSNAQETYRDGYPAEACHTIYNELEALTRRIAGTATRRNLWNDNPPNIDTANGPWANICATLVSRLNIKRCNCPNLRVQLLHRIAGITDRRNLTGHRVNSKRTLIERDRVLRTSFEFACDLLLELDKACRPLRLR